MGWMLKVAALVVGLLSLSLGFWPLWIPCFGYLAYCVWSATRKRRVYIHSEEKSRGAPKAKRSHFKKRYILGGLFLLLSLAAFGDHGSYAPWVFLGLGGLTIASGVFGRGPSFSQVRPVPNSILLRSRWLPIAYTSLVEVKFGTQQMSKALSSAGNEIIMTVSSEKVSAYLPVRVMAMSVPAAESKVAERLAPVARMLSAKGAFPFPLESEEAASRLSWSLEPVDIALEYGRDGVVSLNSTPFDVLVLAPSGHLLESAAAYITRPGRSGHFVIPGKGSRLESKPLFWEALETLAERHSPPNADALTGFLSSVSATRGEGLGDRLENGGQTESGKLVLGSLGSAKVELTRPQLRAIVKAYG